MGRRKNYPWDSKVDKKMTNLISGILAGIISVPISACKTNSKKKTCNNHTPKVTNKNIGEETLFWVIMALVGSYYCISLMIDTFSDDEVLAGCIVTGLFILLWICVIFQVRRYLNYINKDDEESK